MTAGELRRANFAASADDDEGAHDGPAHSVAPQLHDRLLLTRSGYKSVALRLRLKHANTVSMVLRASPWSSRTASHYDLLRVSGVTGIVVDVAVVCDSSFVNPKGTLRRLTTSGSVKHSSLRDSIRLGSAPSLYTTKRACTLVARQSRPPSPGRQSANLRESVAPLCRT